MSLYHRSLGGANLTSACARLGLQCMLSSTRISAHLSRTAAQVTQTGARHWLHFGLDGGVRSTAGFEAFCGAAGISLGASVTLAVCKSAIAHLHIVPEHSAAADTTSAATAGKPAAAVPTQASGSATCHQSRPLPPQQQLPPWQPQPIQQPVRLAPLATVAEAQQQQQPSLHSRPADGAPAASASADAPAPPRPQQPALPRQQSLLTPPRSTTPTPSAAQHASTAPAPASAAARRPLVTTTRLPSSPLPTQPPAAAGAVAATPSSAAAPAFARAATAPAPELPRRQPRAQLPAPARASSGLAAMPFAGGGLGRTLVVQLQHKQTPVGMVEALILTVPQVHHLLPKASSEQVCVKVF